MEDDHGPASFEAESSPRVYARLATGSGLPPEGQGPHDRDDHVVWVPLAQLFVPDPDPTDPYPGESAELEGYFIAPGETITVAVTAGSSRGTELIDSVWNALWRKGLGVRHLTVVNDRGRIVSLMTLRLSLSEEMLRLLRTLLVVPVRSKDGLAEVHLLATPDEVATLQGKLEKEEQPMEHPYVASLPPARQTGPLQPEDWAFLGLLSAVGVLDAPEGPAPGLVAEALGIDPSAFLESASRVERGLEGVVTGLFGPSAPLAAG